MDTITELETAINELLSSTGPEKFEAALTAAQDFAETFKVPLATALNVIRIRHEDHGDPTTPTHYPYPGGKTR